MIYCLRYLIYIKMYKTLNKLIKKNRHQSDIRKKNVIIINGMFLKTNDIIDDYLWSNYYKINKDINIDEIFEKINNKDISLDKIKERVNSIENYRNSLKKIRELPLIKQRTDEWYKLRENKLTASDLGDAINTNNHNLIKKKAFNEKSSINFNVIPAIKWGTMFEAMASRCYSQKYNNINIYEFGLISHEKLENFGASPDGINELGIMIEIKCPYSRQIIDNYVPPKYNLQIQGQLSVCNLNECHYIECNFKSYDTIEEYNKYNLDDKTNHGIIIEYKNKKLNEFYYIYSDPDLTKKEALENIIKKFDEFKDENFIFIKYTYWDLIEMNIQKVYFNKNEWDNNIEKKIIDFWDKVEELRRTKKPKKNLFIEEEDD